MKNAKVFVLFLLVLAILCSCTAKQDDVVSGEQSDISSADLESSESDTDFIYPENESAVLGKFGGAYSFELHYAQTPDNFFYVEASIHSADGQGIFKLEKTDLSRKISLASKADFGIKDDDKFSADIIGVTSKWLFVSVFKASELSQNTQGAPYTFYDVYKIAIDDGASELLLESVESAYLHPANGKMYFTKRDENKLAVLYSYDFESGEKNALNTNGEEVAGFYWRQLKDEKIGLSNYLSYLIIDKEGALEICQSTSVDVVAEDKGRDESLSKFIEGFLTDNHSLDSYAECSGYIYYIDYDTTTRTQSFCRMDADGKNITVIKENSNIRNLFSYKNQMYGDINEADCDRLVKVSEDGTFTETNAVSGLGHSGYVKIEGGLFIRTYRYANESSLMYVYNPTNGDVANT